MKYKDLLVKYIEDYSSNTPIFIEEIKQYFKEQINNEKKYKQVMNNIYVYLNRLIRKGELNFFLMVSITK